MPKKKIDELYLISPYCIAGDGEVGRQAFALIREVNAKGSKFEQAARINCRGELLVTWQTPLDTFRLLQI